MCIDIINFWYNSRQKGKVVVSLNSTQIDLIIIALSFSHLQCKWYILEKNTLTSLNRVYYAYLYQICKQRTKVIFVAKCVSLAQNTRKMHFITKCFWKVIKYKIFASKIYSYLYVPPWLMSTHRHHFDQFIWKAKPAELKALNETRNFLHEKCILLQNVSEK